jgi:hypothetical protein
MPRSFYDFRKKVRTQYQGNWEEAYNHYFKPRDQKVSYYQPAPWPEVFNEEAFEEAFRSVISWYFYSLLWDKGDVYRLPEAFRSERALLLNLCERTPKLTFVVSDELRQDISFWKAAIRINAEAAYGVWRPGSYVEDEELAKALFSDEKFLRETIFTLPQSKRKAFVAKLFNCTWADMLLLSQMDSQLHIEKSFLNELDTYIKQLESDALYYSCTHTLFGGYSKKSRLKQAKELREDIINRSGEARTHVLASWCNETLDRYDFSSVLDTWEGGHPGRKYAYGLLLMASVGAFILSSATLAAAPWVLLAVLSTLTFVLSAYQFNGTSEIQDECPSALRPC